MRTVVKEDTPVPVEEPFLAKREITAVKIEPVKGRTSSDTLDTFDTRGTPADVRDKVDYVLPVSSRIAVRYEIASEGICGGMGVAYKCLDLKRDKDITALKVIHPRLLHSEEALKMFRQEVALSCRLSHDSIVRVHDIGSHGGMEYFTMEWIEGVSLRMLIKERKKQDMPFKVEEAIEIISPLCEALQYAHHYTIHRDIKPENILVIAGGNTLTIKLIDFGIAKMLTALQFATTTNSMGTPYYMAPEQKLDTGHVDKRVDIYSVGVLLFELLTLENTIGPELPSDLNPDLPKEVDEIFRKAVALRPERRYQEIREIAMALKALSSQGEYHLPEKKGKTRRRLLLVGVLLIATVIGFAMYQSKPASGQQQTETSAKAPALSPASSSATPVAPIESLPRWSWVYREIAGPVCYNDEQFNMLRSGQITFGALDIRTLDLFKPMVVYRL